MFSANKAQRVIYVFTRKRLPLKCESNRFGLEYHCSVWLLSVLGTGQQADGEGAIVVWN